MLRSILSLSVLFTATLSQPIIPGAGLAMRGFSILDPENTVSAQIVDVSFTKGKTTPEGTYKIPDNFLYADQRICRLTAETVSSDVYDEIKDTITNSFTIEGGFKKFMASLSLSNQNIKTSINKFQQTVSYTESKCFEYSLGYSGIQLADWFKDEVYRLPIQYNEQAKSKYFHFFSQYGDHVMTQCNIGGLLKQTVTTNSLYAKTSTLDKITNEAKLTFLITIDESYSKEHQVDQAFSQNSTQSSILAVGGTYPQTKDNFNDWAKSIQNLENVACTHWKAQPISDFLEWDELASKRQPAME